MSVIINLALNKLAIEFEKLDLTFHEYESGKKGDLISYFPGKQAEEVMLCVFQGSHIHEPFHRQDFFFLNFAYTGEYDALSSKYNNKITVKENECYIGQPYSGYALCGNSNEPVTIIGVLIRKETFFKEYLSVLSSDSTLFQFWLTPQTDLFSDEFIHLSFSKEHPVRTLLELMVIEYADRKEDTQLILKPMLLSLFMHIARRYRMEHMTTKSLSLTDQIIHYITDHMAKISLSEIAAMLGYSNHSNFYKAFKEYYRITPREYI